MSKVRTVIKCTDVTEYLDRDLVISEVSSNQRTGAYVKFRTVVSSNAQKGKCAAVRQATDWLEQTRTIASVSNIQPLLPASVTATPISQLRENVNVQVPECTHPICMCTFHAPQHPATVGATNRYEGWGDTVFAATRQIMARLRFLLMRTLANQQQTRITFHSIFDEFETLFMNDARHFYCGRTSTTILSESHMSHAVCVTSSASSQSSVLSSIASSPWIPKTSPSIMG